MAAKVQGLVTVNVFLFNLTKRQNDLVTMFVFLTNSSLCSPAICLEKLMFLFLQHLLD